MKIVFVLRIARTQNGPKILLLFYKVPMNPVARCSLHFFVRTQFFSCFRRKNFSLQVLTGIPKIHTYVPGHLLKRIPNRCYIETPDENRHSSEQFSQTNAENETKCFSGIFMLTNSKNSDRGHTRESKKEKHTEPNENMHTNLLAGKNVSRLF